MPTTYKPALRAEVFEAISSERDYQNALGPDRRAANENQFSVGEWLVMMKVYVDKALVAWTDNPGIDAAMNAIRKVSAIGVAAMEEHGAPHRIIVPV